MPRVSLPLKRGFYRGYEGSLFYKPNGAPTTADAVAGLQNWTLRVSQDALPTTTLADESESFRPGRRSASGTLSALLYRRQQGDPDFRTVSEFRDRIIQRATGQIGDKVPAYVRLLFQPLPLGGVPSLGDFIDLRVWFTEVSYQNNADGLIELSVSFSAQGGAAIENSPTANFLTLGTETASP